MTRTPPRRRRPRSRTGSRRTRGSCRASTRRDGRGPAPSPSGAPPTGWVEPSTSVKRKHTSPEGCSAIAASLALDVVRCASVTVCNRVVPLRPSSCCTPQPRLLPGEDVAARGELDERARLTVNRPGIVAGRTTMTWLSDLGGHFQTANCGCPSRSRRSRRGAQDISGLPTPPPRRRGTSVLADAALTRYGNGHAEWDRHSPRAVASA